MLQAAPAAGHRAMIPQCATTNVEQVRAKLAMLVDPLAQLGLKSLLLFGSGARGVAGDRGDSDFGVEFGGPAPLNRYMGL